ncbi:MAG: hypothetical protein IK066_02045 [Kiritimatiellae bacterium]|nr:hypothetical protein [Kiritimatiellia bacterium]
MRAHYHVAGVAGVGMSALAQALTWSGARVTGSDRFFDRGEDLEIWGQLRASGIELTRQDGSALDEGTAALAYSTAIEADNPEVRRARELGVPLKHRAALLAELAAGRRVVAVAGTAGKTTTTGMLGHALERLGADPTVVNGGALTEWARAGRGVGNVRKGGMGAPWVLEVDESDRSLLNFMPEWTVVTNISQDHFGLEEVRALFREYAGRVGKGIVCGPGVVRWIREGAGRGVEVVEVAGMPERDGDGRWSVEWRGVHLSVPQPGEHNALNALCAAECCWHLGFGAADVARALADFGGIRRRLERVDDGAGDVSVYDDYAHNPAKIAAAWKAAGMEGRRRVLGVWRPHGYGPLRNMMSELAEAFARSMGPEDRLWVLPVFDAGGTADRTVSSGKLVDLLRRRGAPAEPLEGLGDPSAATVAAAIRQGDAVLIMGARDPGLPGFARRLAAIATP